MQNITKEQVAYYIKMVHVYKNNNSEFLFIQLKKYVSILNGLDLLEKNVGFNEDLGISIVFLMQFVFILKTKLYLLTHERYK